MHHHPEPEAPSALLPVPVAAQRLGVGRSTLYVLLGRGDIEAVKVGRRTLVTEVSLARLVAGLPRAEFRGRRRELNPVSIKQTGGRRGGR